MEPKVIARFRAAVRLVLRTPAGAFLRAREHRLVPHLEHELAVFWGADPRDTSRHRIADKAGPVVETLISNHYWSRSLEDLQTKIARGDPSTAMARGAEWHYAFEKTLNAETDETMRVSRFQNRGSDFIKPPVH